MFPFMPAPQYPGFPMPAPQDHPNLHQRYENAPQGYPNPPNAPNPVSRPVSTSSSIPPASVRGVTPAQTPPTPISYAKIGSWLTSLDENDHRSVPGFKFSSFDQLMHSHGFFRINQLTVDLVPVEKLMDMLGTSYGIAVLVLQYAKEDTEAARLGQSDGIIT
jgi:hypothetical protein